MQKNGYAEVGGARFYYEIAGEGPPLVLVHAGITDGRMWDEQFHVFAQHYRVLRYDRRGFGKTAMVAGGYSHHRDLFELLKLLQIEQATLVGCSQGAKIVDFTLEHPEMTDALVLVAPALGGFAFTGDMPRQAEELEVAEEAGDIDQVNELELQIWVDGPYRTPDQVDAQVRERVREMNPSRFRHRMAWEANNRSSPRPPVDWPNFTRQLWSSSEISTPPKPWRQPAFWRRTLPAHGRWK